MISRARISSVPTNRLVSATLVGALMALQACSDSATSPAASATDVLASENVGVASWNSVVLPRLPDSLAFYGGAAQSEAYGVNVRQTVVGWSDRSYNGPCVGKMAFMRRNGVMIDLLRQLPSSYSCLGVSMANDVNDNDVAVGWVLSAAGDKYPWMWSPTGGPVKLTSAGLDVIAQGINNHGVIVGYATSNIVGRHALVWYSPTVQTDIHPLGYQNSQAVDIDDNGVIVGIADGNVAVWLADGTFIDSGHLVGSEIGSLNSIRVFPLAINSRSLVSGSYASATFADTGFAWIAKVGWTDRTAPPTHITDLSNKGRTVGWSTNALGVSQAATRRPGFGASWLTTPTGYTEAWATSVNTCGDIVGVAVKNGLHRAVAWRNPSCDP